MRRTRNPKHPQGTRLQWLSPAAHETLPHRTTAPGLRSSICSRARSTCLASATTLVVPPPRTPPSGAGCDLDEEAATTLVRGSGSVSTSGTDAGIERSAPSHPRTPPRTPAPSRPPAKHTSLCPTATNAVPPVPNTSSTQRLRQRLKPRGEGALGLTKAAAFAAPGHLRLVGHAYCPAFRVHPA